MKKIYTAIALTALTFGAKAQNSTLEWINQYSSLNKVFARDIELDANGNVYNAGGYYSSADFDASSQDSILTSTGGTDMYFMKLDQDGNLIWVKTIGTTSYNEEASYIKPDSDGNVYIAGRFIGTLDFDPGTGTENRTSNSGTYDCFLAKYDSDGEFLWVHTFGGISYDYLNGLTVDDNDNVYITGQYRGTVDFDPSGTSPITQTADNGDIFIQKLDSDGNSIWVKVFEGTGYEGGVGIEIDENYNVFTTGIFTDTIDLDPGTAVDQYICHDYGMDVYVLKLDANGDYQWGRVYGATYDLYSYGLAKDADNNIYTYGYFEDTITVVEGTESYEFISNGYYDGYWFKFSENGEFLNGYSFGSADDDEVTALIVDGAGVVSYAGYAYDTLDIDPTAGEYGYQPLVDEVGFIVKMDEEEVYSIDIFDGQGAPYFNALAVDDEYHLYATGGFYETVDFDPSTAVNDLTYVGSYDGVILKLGAPYHVGVQDFEEPLTLKTYPNPTQNTLYIESDGDFTQYQIFDLQGRLVKSGALTQMNIEVNDLQNGAYILQLNNDYQTVNTRFLKE